MSDKETVSNTSIAHSKIVNSTSVEGSLVNQRLQGGYPKIPKLDLYIPSTLDIDQFLSDYPPSFNFKRDRFVYILDLIYSLPSRKKKTIETYTGFTPINKAILGSIIKDYRRYIDYLKEHKIVEEDNYIVGVKSSGLRFTEQYRAVISIKEITDWSLIKNISYLRKNSNVDSTEVLEYLKNWFNTNLTVDIKGATEYLMEEYRKDLDDPSIKYPELRLNSRLYPIQQLYRSTRPLFFVDKTAGRLHTYITQLKSELRKFLKFNGEPLFSIDVVNSQPYLLQSVLSKKPFINNSMGARVSNSNPYIESGSSTLIMLGVLINNVSNKDDVKLFREIVSSGHFYEEFGKILIENGEIDEKMESATLRKLVKEITFSTFFSKNSAISYVNSIRIFQNIFPNVYEVIRFIKQNAHPTLAIVLQNLEADLILHQTCKFISEERPDILLLTLHDSIITTRDNVDYVQQMMKEVLEKHIGVAPTLKVEEWK